MIAKIIISPSSDSISNYAVNALAGYQLFKNHPDVLWIEGEKLNVEKAKEIREFLSLRPYQASLRAVIVINGQDMNHFIQNALLKSLEEPVGESLIIIGTPTEEVLLPTILSRCHLIFLTSTAAPRITKFDKKIEELISSSLQKRFQIIEKIDEKKELIFAMTSYFREKALESPSVQSIQILKDLIETEKMVKQNVSPRALLEYLMLKLD